MQDDKIYTVEEIRDILKNNKDYFEEKYFVDNFLLFGSYAKNEQTYDSFGNFEGVNKNFRLALLCQL